VDRYGDHLSVQTLTLAMDLRRKSSATPSSACPPPKSIVLRNDSPFRKAEGMEPGIEMLHGENPGPFVVRANDLDFEIDLYDGQKTGLYLDQLQSHAEVAKLAKGKRVLDCFTNQGGFALACAKAGAAHVTAVDVSASACEAARHNAASTAWKSKCSNTTSSISSNTPNRNTTSSSSIRRASPATKRPSWTPCAATRRSTCARSNC
jgi:23S rRNA (cytosine1962-C5)-methyltransferase